MGRGQDGGAPLTRDGGKKERRQMMEGRRHEWTAGDPREGTERGQHAEE